jgi:hypothetical protein
MMTTARHDGRQLVAVLARHGYNQADLARAVELSASAVNKWSKMPVLGNQILEQIEKGFGELKIDIKELHRMIEERAATATVEDLRPQLDGMNRKQLQQVLTILSAGDEARERLRMVIEYHLEHGK